MVRYQHAGGVIWFNFVSDIYMDVDIMIMMDIQNASACLSLES